ncbi:SLC13 family permease, partial [bacterium]|nr:SLC13 family permease [candidate division CSSED10-310 bacterium]
KTGSLNYLGETLLGNKGSLTRKLLRFLPPVAGVSAFFNNTPIVAMLIPVIRHWAKKHNVSVSKFLIPLSYATILGGTCTLIGTSTNLVVHGLMLQNGLPGFSFFEISKVGISITIFGLAALALLGHRLLPERKEPIIEMGEQTREFVVTLKVEPNYQYVEKSVEQAGLRHLKGLFLFQIERNGQLINPVSPDQEIKAHDRLFFTGLPETIVDLQKTPGLSLLKDTFFDIKNLDSDTVTTFEVVISSNSPLIGKNVRESNFRSRYNAVIMAIHRSGERIKQKIGDIVLHAGDTLLILAKHDFMKQWYHTSDFYLVSRSVDVTSKPRWYSFFSMGVLTAMIVLMATNILPVVVAVCLAALILVFSRCITATEARNSIDWKVLLIIASAFGIAKGLDNSGVAHYLANLIILSLGNFGILGLLTAIYVMTNLYTEIITNNAAAAIVVPIALAVAKQTPLIINERALLITVAVAASASFATPIGYQTNLMVYGPGGYKFRDFIKIGIPMNIFIGMVAITAIWFFYL